MDVLFEERDGSFFTGYTPNYLKVYVKAENLHNQILPVVITGLFGDGVTAEIISQN